MIPVLTVSYSCAWLTYNEPERFTPTSMSRSLMFLWAFTIDSKLHSAVSSAVLPPTGSKTLGNGPSQTKEFRSWHPGTESKNARGFVLLWIFRLLKDLY